MSSSSASNNFSAEYTTKRNDHAQWQQPSRRRGTYFGMYAAPKETIRPSATASPAPAPAAPAVDRTPGSSSTGTGNGNGGGRDAADELSQVSANRSVGSASTSRRSGGGGGAGGNTHARTQRFLARVSKKRISGKFSGDEIALFRRKNAELEEALDALQNNFDELEREHFVVQGEYQICQGNVEELNATIKTMEEENKRVNGLLILEKAAAQEAAERTAAVEKKFQAEFDEYKSLSSSTIGKLEASLDSSNDQLQAAQRQLRAMFELQEENQRRKEECKRMKQSLVKAKAYTLHKALNATVAASKSQSVKMQRIIAHLQAEHAGLNSALEEVIAERNVLREELQRRDAADGGTGDNTGDPGAAFSPVPPPHQDAVALDAVTERLEALRGKLADTAADRDALATYARHLEQRLGVGRATPARSGGSGSAPRPAASEADRTDYDSFGTRSPQAEARASPSRQQQQQQQQQQQAHNPTIHISKRGSVHITR